MYNQGIGSAYRARSSMNVSIPSERTVKVPVKKVVEVPTYVKKDVTKTKTEIVENEVTNIIDKKIEYVVKEKPDEKVVSVPKLHIEDKYVYNDIYVDEVLEVEVPVVKEIENIVEVAEDRLVEKEREVNIDVFVPDLKDEFISHDLTMPKLKPVWDDEEFEVVLPRFIEIPVYLEIYEDAVKEHNCSDLAHVSYFYNEMKTYMTEGVDAYLRPDTTKTNGGLVGLSDLTGFCDGLQSVIKKVSDIAMIEDIEGYKIKTFEEAKLNNSSKPAIPGVLAPKKKKKRSTNKSMKKLDSEIISEISDSQNINKSVDPVELANQMQNKLLK